MLHVLSLTYGGKAGLLTGSLGFVPPLLPRMMQIAGCCIINHIQGIIKDHAGEASHPSGYGYGFGINSRFFRMGCLGRRFAIEKEEVLMDPRVWMGVTVTGAAWHDATASPTCACFRQCRDKSCPRSLPQGKPISLRAWKPRRIFQKLASIKNKEPSSSPCCRSFPGKLE